MYSNDTYYDRKEQSRKKGTEPMNENRPVALVTGASRGIGRRIAEELAGNGYDIAVNYTRNEEAARAVQKEIEGRGGRCVLVQADISRSEDRRRLQERTISEFGRIDLLVNNAGVAPRVRQDILETSEESYDEVLSINLKGPYFLTQAVAKTMLELKERRVVETPRIVFITSISAYAVSQTRGEYCISKAGLAMTAQVFAVRLAAHGIPVFEVRPGIILTDMVEKVRDMYDRRIKEGLVPQGRWGYPSDVGLAVSAIASGKFDFSTGQVIEVGGGFCTREL
jgi:NAD(P)-dependent dehydrogenase (short-subunit alcohol dehydrogenase family)